MTPSVVGLDIATCAFVDATTLKLFATGSGRAKKPEMVAAAETC